MIWVQSWLINIVSGVPTAGPAIDAAALDELRNMMITHLLNALRADV